MIEKLPSTWINITLVDLCNSKDGLRRGPFGSAIKKEFFVPDGYKVYEQSNAIYSDVNRGKYYISELKYNELIAFAVKEGDFLVSCSGTLGKITLVPKGAKSGIINQALLRIRTNSNLVNKFYFLYYFRSEVFQRMIFDQSQGTAMNNLIGIKDFKQIEIPLPPINEQQRIVDKLEELFSELDKGIDTLKTAKQQLKVYRQAVLKYAFEGKLTNPIVKKGELPNGWVERSLAKLTIEKTGLRRGPFGSAIKKEFFVSNGYKVYEQSNAIYNDHKRGTYFINESKFMELKNFEVQEGDFIVSCSGTLGKIAQIPEGATKGVINQALLRIRLLNNVLSSKYFLYYFRSEVFQRMIFDQSQGTAMNNLIGIKDFKEITIVFPMSIEDQQYLVLEIESRLSVCDKIEESIEQGLQQAEALRQSILMKAFEGKLSPQDANDEPASLLLERIRAERAVAQPVKKIKTKKVKA